ncbi:MAG TPA: carboxypeptidase-like regulatory domain-containing protein, partial [Opitutaceae bacterium]|nr:carboxypeptidase-like regulatory domain-containing protein [Opitutaceae bacterium]
MKRTRVYLRIILSLTAFTFFLHVVPGNVSAQTTNGMIQGTVHDESGAPIAGVSVSLKSIETGASRSASTDSDGAYEFLSLPA